MTISSSHMDLRSLRYFVETVKLRSFTAAAQSLGVTQSTISKMIRQLENELGEPLLLRDKKRFQLTESGRIVMEQAQDILQRTQNLQTELRHMQALRSGRLHIGIPPMINMLFTEVLQEYRRQYPKIQLYLHEDTGTNMERMVKASELEMGLSILPLEPGSDIAATHVARHDVWAIGHKRCFKTRRENLRLSDLTSCPLVLVNDDFAFSRMLRRSFAMQGLQMNVAARSAHWDWVAEMAMAGMGIALLPEPLTDRLKGIDLHKARVAEAGLHWDVALLWNGRYLSSAARAWIEICQAKLGGLWMDFEVPDTL